MAKKTSKNRKTNKEKRKVLSMEEARELAEEHYGGKVVEATYRLGDKELPYSYRVPTTRLASAATEKAMATRDLDGEAAQSDFGFMLELMLVCLEEAPFEISRDSLERLNPAVFGQIGSELIRYVVVPDAAKKL